MNSTQSPIQIRFVDLDQFGHVNNAIYLSYLEVARLPYFERIIGEIDWLNEGIILAKAEVDYLIPILLKDQIEVKTWCSRIGSKSFDLSYHIVKLEKGAETIVAKAKTVMVCFNYDKQQSIEIPAGWKEKMLP